MKQHRGKLTVLAIVVVVGLVIGVLTQSGEPTFRGKPESYWITNIVYSGPTEQIEQWQSFGPEGVRLLTEYLDRGYGWQTTYRRLYRQYAPKIPTQAQRVLSTPVDNRGSRMCAVSLLFSLALRDTNTARIAEPTIARAMADENPGLRQLAVGAYEGDVLRTQIDPSLKKARLDEFIRLAEDSDRGVRGNAATALSFFPEEAARSAPVLVKNLSESDPFWQLLIARALARVDRNTAAQAGVATIAAAHLRNPDQQTSGIGLGSSRRWEIARQAAEVLGELHSEAVISIPVLIEGLGSTNREIAIASFRALTMFKEQTDETLPSLRKAAVERSDIPNWVKAELHSIDPAGKVAK